MKAYICDRCKATVRNIGTRAMLTAYQYQDPREDDASVLAGNVLKPGEDQTFDLCFACCREWNARFLAFMVERPADDVAPSICLRATPKR